MRRASALVFALLLACTLSACAPSHPTGSPSAGLDPHSATLVDLTHAFDDNTIYWPGNKSFQQRKTAWGPTEKGYWYASATYEASEHGGTHIDAPIHFAEGRTTLDQIPLDRLIGPAVVIDVRSKCVADPDYTLRTADILAWESMHGKLEEGAIVFMFTGWGERWPDPEAYLGTSDTGDPLSLHFPGFSAEAADFLVTQRAVKGVGIDTASIDHGPSRDFPAHQVFSGADVYALENVAALDKVPTRGAIVFALPMKIGGGTGGPVRIIALIP